MTLRHADLVSTLHSMMRRAAGRFCSAYHRPSPLGDDNADRWDKSKLSPVQSISYLSMEQESVTMMARLTYEHAQSIRLYLTLFRPQLAVPLKLFQRLLRHMASSTAVVPLGLTDMRPLQHWLQSRVP